MKQKLPFFHLLLALGTACYLPFAVFTAGNIIFAPWPLYGRNRVLLFALTLLCSFLLFWAFKTVSRHENSFREKEPYCLLCLSILFFFIQMLSWRLLVHTPFTDTEQIITSARSLSETGQFPSGERYTRYFIWYPHNLGTVYLYSILFKFASVLRLSEPMTLIVLFSAILFSFGLFCTARSAQMLGGYSAELRFILLVLLTFPFYYCCSELYTDALSLPFSGIQIYFFLRFRNGRSPKASAVFFAIFSLLGSLIRMTALVVCIACFLSLFFEKRFRGFALLLIMTLCLLVPGRALVQKKNEQLLGKENLNNGTLPVWHYMLLGLPIHEEDGYGQYGDGSWLILSTSFDNPEERDQVLRGMVKDRIYYLRFPNRLLNMVSRKNLATFGDGSFHLNELIEADVHDPDNFLKQILFSQGKLFFLYYHLMTALFLCEFIFSSIACIQSIYQRHFSSSCVFITLLGAFLYLTIWETNARYFFPFHLLLLLGAALLSPHSNKIRSDMSFRFPFR